MDSNNDEGTVNQGSVTMETEWTVIMMKEL